MSDTDQYEVPDDPFDLEHEPLDKASGFDIDWGGDGSDLTRPVRAHILAALRPHTGPYEPPLDALLELGDIESDELERRAAELGIGQHHVSELVRMTRDRALSTADSDTPQVYAPDHALHFLKNLDVSDYIADLLPIFDLPFDMVPYQLTEVLAITGEVALAPTVAYVADRTRWAFGRSLAATAVHRIAEQHPELREQAIASMGDILANAESDEEIAVTGAMGALYELQATEALPLIRHAFEVEKVDEMMYGGWGEVLKHLGVEPDPDDPLIEESERRFKQRHDEMFPQSLRDSIAAFQARHREAEALAAQRAATQKNKQEKARKEKQKRKTASASRKANRKKRK